MTFPLICELLHPGARGARTLLQALALGLLVSACGLETGEHAQLGAPITDPVVAATVDGRPIYIQEVRARADQICAAPSEASHLSALCDRQPGEDVEGRPELFHMALDQLIQQRLFAQEAERRRLDRDPEVLRALDLARERVLADAVYRSLYDIASDRDRVESEYRTIERQLSGRPLVTLSHILLPTREAAMAALRRFEGGEPFERLAFDLSLDRQSATAGGFLPEMPLDELEPAFRDLIGSLTAGEVGGPLRSEDGWHLIRLNARNATQAQSLESRRPAIVAYLLSQEVDGLYGRLAEGAQIRTITEQAGQSVLASPADTAPSAPAPSAREAPMGPGALAADGVRAAATPPPVASSTSPPPAPPTSAPQGPAPRPAAASAPSGSAASPPVSAPPASRPAATTHTQRPSGTVAAPQSDAPIGAGPAGPALPPSSQGENREPTSGPTP